jgi:hypothetical protein
MWRALRAENCVMRPTHVNLIEASRLLGLDLGIMPRLARSGQLGKIDRGNEFRIEVVAIENYALRIFTDAQVHAACNPTHFTLTMERFDAVQSKSRRGRRRLSY